MLGVADAVEILLQLLGNVQLHEVYVIRHDHMLPLGRAGHWLARPQDRGRLMGRIIPDALFLRKAAIESPSRKRNRFLVWVLQDSTRGHPDGGSYSSWGMSNCTKYMQSAMTKCSLSEEQVNGWPAPKTGDALWSVLYLTLRS